MDSFGTGSPTPGTHLGSAALSGAEIAILDFEARWWTYPGSKDSVIREQFAITSVRYYQVLNALIDLPVALERDPLLVRRLRRLRARRTAERSARRDTDLG